jgi:hypothetical protein
MLQHTLCGVEGESGESGVTPLLLRKHGVKEQASKNAKGAAIDMKS